MLNDQFPVNRFISHEPFPLESGAILPRLEVGYTTLGDLSAHPENIRWICHALTANSDPREWWPGLVGKGKCFDPAKAFIVCANMLGSCYGSSGPLALNPETGKPFYRTFPLVTIRDMVRAHIRLRRHLGIERIRFAGGGSMGAQQALEWAIMEPEVVEGIGVLSGNARHSPWGIAFNAAQRMAIEADPTWQDDSATAGSRGLAAARAIGMISYRSYQRFQETQKDGDGNLDGYQAESYERYQGDKLVRRFNAQAYWVLTKAMDSHHVGRGRGPIPDVLKQVKARALIMGVSTDLLFPPCEQKFLAEHIPNAEYHEIESPHGHDGFLIEFDQMERILRGFLTG